jgi:hypothetical protein
VRRVLIAVVAVAGLLLACGGQSEQEALVENLQSDFAMGREQAECVADQLYERFSEDEIETFREAESRDDLPEDLLRRLQTALTPCAGS